jgi:hypothetical protein
MSVERHCLNDSALGINKLAMEFCNFMGRVLGRVLGERNATVPVPVHLKVNLYLTSSDFKDENCRNLGYIVSLGAPVARGSYGRPGHHSHHSHLLAI